VLLIAVLGGLGLVLLARQLAAFRGALVERRLARRARVARAGDLAHDTYVAPTARRGGP